MDLPRSHFARISGFTLVEAMVALVIFSAAAMGIYSWINTNLISLNRLAAVAESEFVVDSAVERLKLVDLRNEAEGVFDVSGYDVHWRASLVEPWKPGRTPRGVISLYDLALFEISLELIKDERSVGAYEFRQVSWYKARKSQAEDDDAPVF
ncbi:PulJ/GspJ family protein [Cellvibrio sp. UBA7671]|uniref:PulJ/GspJ family protein n=1 Tax=Cellvibrio sp. UBA7671 TaxID=1946312 RepID=UPI002F3530C3